MKDINKKFRKKTPRPVDPEKKAAKEKRTAAANRFSLLIHAFFCVTGYFLIEAMARHSAAAAFTYLDQRTKVFFYNALLIFLTTLPVYLTRRRRFYRILIGSIWFVLGAVNGILLLNRVTPLTGPDFKMLKETIGILDAYFTKGEIVLIAVGIVIGLLALIRLFFTSPKYQGKMHRKVMVPVILACMLGFNGLTYLMLQTRQLSNYFSNIAFAYLDYGFPYSLCVTVFDQGISEPRSYSEKLVSKVIREEGKIPESEITEDMPNIVVVQLESFFDATRVRWLKMSEDPLPNWHRLCADYSCGFYTVPTVGAGTVNTEFETLTGMSLRFFGAGEYPYKGILLKETCESAAYDLSSIGYTAHAIHNNEAEFYGRNEVYKNLGFYSFTPEEYMNTQKDVNENGWMRDRNLTQNIFNAIESTSNRDFVFAVSVQAHGAYPTEPSATTQEISVTGAQSDEKNCAWSYYVNQIHEVDQFVADLTDALSDYDEPTVVLFYGDHLPTLGLVDRDLKQGTTFDTNYLLWANFDMERKGKKITSYQAVAEVMDRIGLHVGTMFRFNQTMKNKENYFYNMQVLQYDLLYGKRYVYGSAKPYPPSVLAMGVKPVRIERIRSLKDTEAYCVDGQNFTQSCVVKVNGEACETTYFSSGTLLMKGVELQKGDLVSVDIRSNDASGGILGSTNTLVYEVGRLVDAVGYQKPKLVMSEAAIAAPDPNASFSVPEE